MGTAGDKLLKRKLKREQQVRKVKRFNKSMEADNMRLQLKIREIEKLKVEQTKQVKAASQLYNVDFGETGDEGVSRSCSLKPILSQYQASPVRDGENTYGITGKRLLLKMQEIEKLKVEKTKQVKAASQLYNVDCGETGDEGVSRSCSLEPILSQYQTSLVRDGENTYGITGVVTTRGSPGGLVGLVNLGNTCFMNSAIQCLVHMPEFARYFQEDYQMEISGQSSLNGKLAKAFGGLLRKLLSPGHTAISPHQFKKQLDCLAPQFRGNKQHDSHELLAFLLDGLHEDLNRVKHKPYLKSIDADGRRDEDISDEYWADCIARNDSIIVNLCQGQYKSTLVCPVCGKTSVTFDPFMWLSLPLPSTDTRSMTITVFTSDGSAMPMTCSVTVPKHGRCQDLLQEISSACSLKSGEMILLAEIRGHVIGRFLEDPSILLSSIKDDDHLAAYKIPELVKKRKRLLQFIHRREEKESSTGMVWKPCGTPLVSPISRVCKITPAIIQAIVHRMLSPMLQGVVLKPSDNSSSVSGSPSHASNDVGSSEKYMDSTASGSIDKDDSCSKILPEILPLLLVDDNNAPVDWSKKLSSISMGEGKTIKLSSVFIDWSKKLCDKYDFTSLENLREVLKYGPPSKKARNEHEPLSLYTCLEAFLSEEPLLAEDMWDCPQCKERRQASKKLDLWRLPEVLVIHLKRFSHNLNWQGKLETYVNFPTHDLDLMKYVANKNGSKRELYELYALSNHYGSMEGGHYTAHIKLLDENKWYKFDDSEVSPINEADVKSAAAYVLFYRRVKTEDVSVSNGDQTTERRVFCGT